VATFSSDTRPIIGRGPSLAARFILLAAASIGLMVADHRYDYLNHVRQVVSSGVYPVQWLVDAPFRLSRWATEGVVDRDQLRVENTRLATQLRDAKVDLQRLAALTEENRRLRELGDAASVVSGRRAIAQIMSVDLDPLRHRVLLNKGQSDGVFKGQPVLDAQGVFGQITQVGRYTSQAIMISDPEHSIPVRVNRSGLRTIAEGTGNLNKLNLPFLTGEADVKVGDLLIASGLGGVFPPGYPVAEISRVERNPADTFATVEAKPLARLDRDYEVVLLWYKAPAVEPATDKVAPSAASSSSAARAARSSAGASSASSSSPSNSSRPASATTSSSSVSQPTAATP
jgi:rod shape-determining protein MreC